MKRHNLICAYAVKLNTTAAAALIAALATVTSGLPARADFFTATWNASAQATGNWEDSNWTFADINGDPVDPGQTFPNNNGNSFDVTIDNFDPNNSLVTVTSDITIGNILVSDRDNLSEEGDTLRVAGSLTVGGNLQVGGFPAVVEVQSGGSLFVEGDLINLDRTAIILDVGDTGRFVVFGDFNDTLLSGPNTSGGFFKRGKGLLDIVGRAYVEDSTIRLEEGSVSLLLGADIAATLLEISATSIVLVSDSSVAGGLDFSFGNTLRIEIESPDKFGKILIGGTVDFGEMDLAALLEFDVSGFVPKRGDIFEFLAADELLFDIEETLLNFTVNGVLGRDTGWGLVFLTDKAFPDGFPRDSLSVVFIPQPISATLFGIGLLILVVAGVRRCSAS